MDAPMATHSSGFIPLKGSFPVIFLRREDKELGEVLIKGFLGTLSKLETPPAVLALMNEGVKLALPDASTCD